MKRGKRLAGVDTVRQRDRGATSRNLQEALESLKQHNPEKISIAAVAREAGITPALIHNKYPEFAEQIRRATGKATRAQRDEKHRLLVIERDQNRALREERDALLHELRDLASENESLRRQLDIQKAIAAGSVACLRSPAGR